MYFVTYLVYLAIDQTAIAIRNTDFNIHFKNMRYLSNFLIFVP